jgi:hypothetical protein
MIRHREMTRLGGLGTMARVLAVLATVALPAAQATPTQEAGDCWPRAEFSTPQWVTLPVTAPRVRHETFDSAAALCEVETSFRFPVYLAGIVAELPGMAAEDAVISWAIRRGRAWRPNGRTDCWRRAGGPR